MYCLVATEVRPVKTQWSVVLLLLSNVANVKNQKMLERSTALLHAALYTSL